MKEEKPSNWFYHFNQFIKEIPLKWRVKTLDNLQGDYGAIKDKLLSWDFKTPELVSIISSKNGIGKTHIAVCMFKKFIHDWMNDNDYAHDKPFAHFAKERNILAEIQSSYREKSERGEKEILDNYIHARFLVIDDIFADRQNDFSRRIMLHILDERAEWLGYPTLITSNLGLSEIKDIDTRIMSRINNSMCIEITSDKFRDYRKNL